MKDRKLVHTPASIIATVLGNFNNAETAAIPGGIESQETAGQLFVMNNTLPIEIDRGSAWSGCEAAKRMGIRLGQPVDRLFISVALPPGWKEQATSHSMWTDLLDDKGRKRAAIFFKADPCDRRAFVNFETRYRTGSQNCDEHGNRVEGFDSFFHKLVVMDVDTVIYQTAPVERMDLRAEDAASKEVTTWLRQRFPNWRDPSAHWD